MYTHLLSKPALGLSLMLVLFLTGCVTTDYMGRSYAPTQMIDVYYDEADIERPYEVMGELRTEAPNTVFFKMTEKMQRKMVEQARQRGADGLIVGGMAVRSTGQTEHTTGETTYDKKGRARTSSTTTVTEDEVKEVRALLIKYKPAT